MARSTFPSQNVKNTRVRTFLEVAMSKKCTPLWREAHFEVKMYKTHTFGSCEVETVHAVVARSTFGSQNVQNIRGSEHTLHYTKLHYTTLNYTTLHYTTLHYTTLHYTTLPSTTLHYTSLHYTTLHYTTTTTAQLHSTALNHTTLHYTTLHSTTLDYTTLHFTE